MTKARDIADLSSVSARLDTVGGSSGALSNRNLIINGNMKIAQRGTSQTAAGYGTIDRFSMSLSGATATMTQQSFTIGQTDVVGSDKFLKLAVSTGNNNSGVYYKVEAKDAFSVIGQKVTLSYYAKGTSPTNGLEVAIGWYDGSTSSSYDTETVTLTSSWVKYTHTFDVPSISGLTLTNAAAYLEVHWIQADTDTGTAAYEVNLAQVQLEIGDTATDFEHRSFGDELYSCQRYYIKHVINGINGQIVMVQDRGSATYYGQLNWMQEMRVAPTVTGTGIDRVHKPGVVYDTITTGPNFYQASVNGMYILAVASTTHATSSMAFLGASSGGSINIDAEL